MLCGKKRFYPPDFNVFVLINYYEMTCTTFGLFYMENTGLDDFKLGLVSPDTAAEPSGGPGGGTVLPLGVFEWQRSRITDISGCCYKAVRCGLLC